MRTIHAKEYYIGTQAERLGEIPGLQPGHEFYETDSGLWWWYTGEAWLQKESTGTSSYEARDLAANRPEANEVPIGFVYWSVDTGSIDVSDGSEWKNLGEV